MQSMYYLERLEQGRRFQESNKTWSGIDSVKWGPRIKTYLDKFDCKTVLDYGCGKGIQYREPVIDDMSLDSYWAVAVDLYDPCVSQYDQLSDRVYDAVISTQVLGCVPDLDVQWVIDLMAGRATKLLFIGILDVGSVKSSKTNMRNSAAYLETRDEQWYKSKLSHINHITVVLEYRKY